MASVIPKLLEPVARAFRVSFNLHGDKPKGVLWNNQEGQELRFELLIGVMGDDVHEQGLTVNDLGCGYGAFFGFLENLPPMEGGRYRGYDICGDMIETAIHKINDPRATFHESSIATGKADYSFASGTFNLKQTASDKEWDEYVKESLVHLWRQSAKGLAFNILDGARKIKPEKTLYYPKIEDLMDFCRRNLSANTKLVDSSPLMEWTLQVRR